MRTIHRSCHRCPFPKPPPPLLQATAVTPPGRKPIFHMPWRLMLLAGNHQPSLKKYFKIKASNRASKVSQITNRGNRHRQCGRNLRKIPTKGFKNRLTCRHLIVLCCAWHPPGCTTQSEGAKGDVGGFHKSWLITWGWVPWGGGGGRRIEA